MTETVLRRKRKTMVARDASAGCFSCRDKFWFGAYAQALAARHHDDTGHPTWCLVNLTIRYGDPPDLDAGAPFETRSAA